MGITTSGGKVEFVSKLNFMHLLSVSYALKKARKEMAKTIEKYKEEIKEEKEIEESINYGDEDFTDEKLRDFLNVAEEIYKNIIDILNKISLDEYEEVKNLDEIKTKLEKERELAQKNNDSEHLKIIEDLLNSIDNMMKKYDENILKYEEFELKIMILDKENAMAYARSVLGNEINQLKRVKLDLKYMRKEEKREEKEEKEIGSHLSEIIESMKRKSSIKDDKLEEIREEIIKLSREIVKDMKYIKEAIFYLTFYLIKERDKIENKEEFLKKITEMGFSEEKANRIFERIKELSDEERNLAQHIFNKLNYILAQG